MAVFTFDDAVAAFKAGEDLQAVTQKLLDGLTTDERLDLLDGDMESWTGMADILANGYNHVPLVMGHVPRVGIPGVRFTDGPRGCSLGKSTAFPVSMARGATWDVTLERRVGEAIGSEGRAQGANFYGGVCVNLLRHGSWGRSQETYGEDPIHLGEFGRALSRGAKTQLMTCVKHYALNSIENSRFSVDVIADDRALHEVYLPHFRYIVEDGVESVMSAYNSVNGEWCGQSKLLLIDILREKWGFKGLTISDFSFGLRDAVLSVKNGLDLEAPFRQIRGNHLPAALDNGELTIDYVDIAARNILSTEITYAARIENTPVPSKDVVFSRAHRDLAREVGARSITLLENRQIQGQSLLPLAPETVKSFAVLGRLIHKPNLGDNGSSAVHPPETVTIADGLKAAFSTAEASLDDSDSVERYVELARGADVAFLVVGNDHFQEGEYLVPPFEKQPEVAALLGQPKTEEAQKLAANMAGASSKFAGGGDRVSLRLRQRDVEAIKAVSAVNPRTIVAVVTGGVVINEEWKDLPAAVLMSWYGGVEGGNALADVVTGRVDASGRLPFSVVQDEKHLPHFESDTTSFTYDIWYGQRLIDRLGAQAGYPLGYGLSYTRFSSRNLSVTPSAEPERITVKAEVTNEGDREGRYIAQVYGSITADDFPSRLLLGFAAVDLSPKETKKVSIEASIRPLQRWTSSGFTLASKDVQVEFGRYSGDAEALVVKHQL